MSDRKQNEIEVRDLSKRYGRNKYIIKGMQARFVSGTATGLIGANGAGKTTFLRILSASAFPTSGNVFFNGTEIHKHVHSYLSSTGIVGDTGDLPQFMTADELVEGIMRIRGVWDNLGKQAEANKNRLFEAVELDDRRHDLIGTYSSGMMQKTMIAAALSGNPEILLLDEPFRALDESAVRSVMTQLQEFKSNGGIILVSSHQANILDELCDKSIRFPVV